MVKPKNTFRDEVEKESPKEMAEREQKVLMYELRARKELNRASGEDLERTKANVRRILTQLRNDVQVLPPSERKQATLDHVNNQLKMTDEQITPDYPPKDQITLDLLEEKFAAPEPTISEGEDTDTSEELKDE